MASLRRRGAFWYYRFVDHDGRRVERKGTSDKRETEKLAAAAETEVARVQAGLVDPKAVALKDHASRPLGDHLEAFERHLETISGPSRRVTSLINRLKRLVAIVMGATVAQTHRPPSTFRVGEHPGSALIAHKIARARIGDLTAERVQVALVDLKASGLGNQSVQHYRSAAKQFDRWLRDAGRSRALALGAVRGFNPAADRRHDRRALSLEELRGLIVAAEGGEPFRRVPGSVRALVYRLAVGTGLRYNELRSLKVESFSWNPPAVRVEIVNAKNRREAVQPIPSDLAADLREFVESLSPGSSVFPLPANEGAKMIRVDLEAAGIPYKDDAGRVFDFHALRCMTATLLDQAGVSPRLVQRIMRHSTPGLTDRYTRPRREDVERAALSIPPLAPDGSPLDANLAPLLPHLEGANADFPQRALINSHVNGKPTMMEPSWEGRAARPSPQPLDPTRPYADLPAPPGTGPGSSRKLSRLSRSVGARASNRSVSSVYLTPLTGAPVSDRHG